MKLSKDARKTSRDLFRASFTDGRLDPNKTRIIANQVIRSKPHNFVGILKDYQRLVRLEVEKHHAIVESPAPLDPQTAEQLTKSLQARYGNDLTTEFQVAPTLIGGLRIRIGSDVFDSSIRGRLSILQNQFAQA